MGVISWNIGTKANRPLFKITSNLVECPFIKTFYMELNKKSKYFV